MGRNFDFKSNVENFRRRLYRSRRGKLLGVFSGIAESLGYSVCATRWVGVVLLLVLAGNLGADGFWVMLMVGGFFYMLAALLMQPPQGAGNVPAASERDEDDFIPPPIPPQRWAPSGAPLYPGVNLSKAPVDLAQISQQLDSLNRRIQRMETIVTDRQYDWDRRLDS